MDWNAIYPGPEEPTAEQLSAYVSHPMWEPLNRWICEAYSLSPIYSYSSCSMGRGWNVKYRSGGKALCTLYPAAGAFTCLVVAPAQAEALLPTLSEYTQACWQAVKPMGSGRWLSLEVDSPEVVEDIKTLLMLKRPLKKTGTGIACPCFLWYNSGKAALTLAFQPFCRPLRGSRKTYHNYTIPLMLPGIRTKSAA